MARIRSIKPELLEDEKVASLSHLEWRLFVSCILLADDYGNFRSALGRVHGAALWAHPREGLAKALDTLAAIELLTFYVVAAQLYAHVVGWEKHQKVDHPGKPLCPALTSDSRISRETLAKLLDGLAPDQDQDPDLGSGPLVSPYSRGSDPESDAPARSNSGAGFGGMAPPRAPYRPIPVGLITPAFLSVFEAYPRKDAKHKAAMVFDEIAAGTPGGPEALAAAILAAFKGGMLSRHPYHGRNATRPMLETILVERRWEDPASAPDDVPDEKPAENFEVRAERQRAERAEDARLERVRAELRPRVPQKSPRQEWLEEQAKRKAATS